MSTIIKAASSAGGWEINPSVADGTMVIQSSAADGTSVVDAISISAAGVAATKGISDTVGIASPKLLVQDQKAVGTDGGTSSSATSHIRNLNTVVTNTITGASLASNQITLPAGTFEISGSTPCMHGSEHKCYLYNTTTAALAIAGTSEYTHNPNNIQTRSFFTGRLVLASATVFELRHYIGVGRATDGLGMTTNVAAAGVEVYSTIQVVKEA